MALTQQELNEIKLGYLEAFDIARSLENNPTITIERYDTTGGNEEMGIPPIMVQVPDLTNIPVEFISANHVYQADRFTKYDDYTKSVIAGANIPEGAIRFIVKEDSVDFQEDDIIDFTVNGKTERYEVVRGSVYTDRTFGFNSCFAKLIPY